MLFEIGGIREFVYDVDGPAFLKMDQMGFGMDGNQ